MKNREERSRAISSRTLKSALLGATMLAAGFAVQAYAQDAAAPATTPAPAPAATPAAASDDATVVVVTGYRGSLQSATLAKKRAVGFQDSIFAEDIGKFPDTNIAESFNRIPGVIISRDINGDGVNVSIRGLGTSFTRVLLNGAPVAVASTGSTDSQSTNREVDLDLFPTELFTQLTVDKSPQASEVEGGAAGVVNMRQARPFDHKGPQLSWSVAGTDSSNADKWGNKASLLASDTFGNWGILGGIAITNQEVANKGFETIGWTNANLSAAQDSEANRNSTGGGNWTIPATVPANAGNGLTTGAPLNEAALLALNPGLTITQIDNAIIPRLGRPMTETGTRDRISGIFGLEWRPSDDFHAYLDTMYAHKENKMQRQDMNWVGRNGAMIPINMKVDGDCSDGCTVTSGTFANSQFFLEYRPYTETTNFYSVNPGFDWKINDTLDFSASANYTRSTFHRESPSFVVITPASSGLTVSYTNNGDVPTIDSNVDLNDPSSFGWNGGRVNIQDEKRVTMTKGVRGDLKWGTSAFNLQFGAAYDDTSRSITAFDNSQAWQNAVCGDNPNVTLPSPNSQPPCQGLDTATPGAGYPTYPGLGTGYSTGNTTPLAYQGSLIPQSSLANYLSPGAAGFVTVDWNKFATDSQYAQFHNSAPLATSSNTGASGGFVEEKVSAVYIQFNGDRDIFGGHRLRYNGGVRLLSTDQTIGGYVSLPDPRNTATPVPADGAKYPNIVNFVETKSTYKDYLPSFSAVFNATENLLIRASTSVSMTRANPNTMLPGLNFSTPSADVGSVGNPNLKPYISKNIDLGVEYYTGKEGYLSATYFTKSINGFTANGNTTVPFGALAQYGVTYAGLTPTQQAAIDSRGGPDNATVVLTQQVNASGLLHIRGLELNWVQPLGRFWSPLEGFGYSLNATYIHQRGSGAAPAIAIGVPKMTYNGTLYYERYGFSFHLSDNYNGKSVASGTNQNGITEGANYNDSRSQIDLSSSYDLSHLVSWGKDLEVTFDVTNLTDTKLRSYFQFENATFTEYDPGSTVMIGLRGKF
ncbi:TonB-dependent receptor [Asticcacaulis sp. EMRT-3]|uniref:TonB-dependent receptor n=1 Tax=Asticcacaulis sp. EMRT-3 TaxID=3040349 RepID=UPI0024AF377E|nr:TonB-dependent receptor [Asticcacaulis sp. EMRT-3]MDI7776454.1 TonB-dependent receptor [Asticcacaulis sp. EMRT-3]